MMIRCEVDGKKKGKKKHQKTSSSLYLCLDKGGRGVNAEREATSGAPGGDLLVAWVERRRELVEV